MKKIIICFLLFFTVTGYGQNYNNWFLKDGVFLDFNSGKPTYLRIDSLVRPSLEYTGHASISDKTGKLLFYTDGYNVWNAQNKVMPNGMMAASITSISQSSLIVPHPGNPNQYYLFTTNYSGVGGLNYSVIDMTLDNGRGDISNIKNVKLPGNILGLTTAIQMANGKDFWIIAHDRYTSFYVYRLTASGIDANPVLTSIGSSYFTSYGLGYLKHSKKGEKLAMSNYGLGLFEIFNFDITTGSISEVITSPASYPFAYGVEFSPDDSRLYVSCGDSLFSIYQINLKAGTPSDIINSTLLIANPQSLPPGGQMGCLQKGPDCKIYAAKENINTIGVINDPDALGSACNYVDDQLVLPVFFTKEAFPRDFPSFFEMPCCASDQGFLGQDTILCNNYSFLLSAGTGNSYLWSTGSTNSSIVISHPGNYWVQLTTDECIKKDTLNITNCDQSMIEFPTVFTPNNDGQNDRFVPVMYNGIDNASLKIYNRWGKEVLSTTDILQGWDGSSNGNHCDAGTYFWTLQYATDKGESVLLKGIITLLN